MRTPIAFDPDLGLDLDEDVLPSTRSIETPTFNADSIETAVVQSLDSALSTLKREFVDEFRSLLECCSYDTAIHKFSTELHSEVSEIISSGSTFEAFEFPYQVIEEKFGALKLPEGSKALEKESELPNIQPIIKSFVKTASGLLDEVVNEKVELTRIRNSAGNGAESAHGRVLRARFEVEAVEVQQRITKELLEARFQRLDIEKAEFHGRQAKELEDLGAPEPVSPDQTLADIRALLRRNSKPGIGAKTAELARLAIDVRAAVEFLNYRLLAAVEGVAPPARDMSFSCTEIDIPHDNDLVATVQARLIALRRQREDAEKEITELRTR
jgi:hypothetical protein